MKQFNIIFPLKIYHDAYINPNKLDTLFNFHLLLTLTLIYKYTIYTILQIENLFFFQIVQDLKDLKYLEWLEWLSKFRK